MIPPPPRWGSAIGNISINDFSFHPNTRWGFQFCELFATCAMFYWRYHRGRRLCCGQLRRRLSIIVKLINLHLNWLTSFRALRRKQNRRTKQMKKAAIESEREPLETNNKDTRTQKQTNRKYLFHPSTVWPREHFSTINHRGMVPPVGMFVCFFLFVSYEKTNLIARIKVFCFPDDRSNIQPWRHIDRATSCA